MTVYQARVYDALRWVAQEATALKMTDHALPEGSRLREALAALTEAYAAPDDAPSGLALVRERMSALDAALRVVLDAAEAAIDAHPGLTRAMRSAPAFTAPPYTAEVSRCRLGYTVACQVYGDNKRTRTPTRITGFGETLADAIAAFEGGLDAWAAVLK